MYICSTHINSHRSHPSKHQKAKGTLTLDGEKLASYNGSLLPTIIKITILSNVPYFTTKIRCWCFWWMLQKIPIGYFFATMENSADNMDYRINHVSLTIPLRFKLFVWWAYRFKLRKSVTWSIHGQVLQQYPEHAAALKRIRALEHEVPTPMHLSCLAYWYDMVVFRVNGCCVLTTDRPQI